MLEDSGQKHNSRLVYHSYSVLRNNASGPEICLPGRNSAGFYSGEPQNLPSCRPSAGRGGDVGAFPIRLRLKPGPSPISGPEVLLRHVECWRMLGKRHNSRSRYNTLCYAVVLPGRKSIFQDGFHRESLKIWLPPKIY